MMMSSKMQKKQRIDFKVKFSHNQAKDNMAASRGMILSVRQRTCKDASFKSSQVVAQEETEEQKSSEQSGEASKQDLHTHSGPTRPMEALSPSLSNITSNFEVLSSFFEEEVSFKLIFRASNHNFSVRQFHEVCDAYEDTVTLCLTEDNKIIGGYTPLSWEEQFQKCSTHFKTDFKRETFLFSVTDRTKYPLVKSLKNKAICCFKSYGPTFGGGYDLLIGDRCNEIPNATSYFPRNFQHPNQANFNKRGFTGTSRKNFKLQEWEVFHVIKVHSLKTIENINFTQAKQERSIFQSESLWEKTKKIAKQVIKALCNDN